MRISQITLSAVTVLTVSAPATAQRVGPLVLGVPAGTRALAMGNAGISSRTDDVIFYGPAQLGVAEGTSVGVNRYGPASRGLSLSSAGELGSGGYGIGAALVTYHTPGAYPFERDALTADGTTDGSAAVFMAGVAQTYWGTRFGLTAKVASEDYGPGRRESVSGDIGAARDFAFKDVRFAVALAVQDIGDTGDSPGPNGIAAQFQKTQLPLRATVGASTGMPVGPLDLAAALSVSAPRDGTVITGGGLELGYSWLDGWDVYLRGGARTPQIGQGAATAGAGISLDRVSLDYAAEALEGGRVAHRLSFRVR